MTQEQKIKILTEAVLRLYGNLSILPPRDAEIVEMLNKIVEEGGEKDEQCMAEV